MVGKTKSTIRQNKKYNLRRGKSPSKRSDKMAKALLSRNRERGAVVWHSSLVVVVAFVLLRHNLQLVAEVVKVTLDRLETGCLDSRFKTCDGIAGSEYAVLHHFVLTQSLLLAEPPYSLLDLLCGHLFVL